MIIKKLSLYYFKFLTIKKKLKYKIYILNK